MSDLPNSVYKYLHQDRIGSIMQKLLIRFSQVSALNDALEFKPALKGMGPRAAVEQGVLQRLKVNHPEILARIEAIYPPKEAAQLVSELVSIAADSVESEANYKRSIKEFYDKLDQNFGVLSLSETPLSQLMWSHYADGGRGFLIKFDAQHPWFWDKREEGDSFRHLRQMKYIERTPAYFLNLPDDVALYSKSIEWSYEKEWRIIRNFNDAALKVGPDSYGKDVLLFTIPPESIRSIVIGYETADAMVQATKSIVALNPSLAHVTFQRAKLNDDGGIEIREEC